MSNWELRLGDCLEPVTGLASLPDKSVDHVICDPPYTQKTSENARSRKDKKDGGAFIGDSGKRYINFDGVDGLEQQIVSQCLRVARRWVIVFCALEQLGAYALFGGERWVRGTVWTRTNPAPQFTGDRPGQACEGIAILHDLGRKRWNRGGESLSYTGPTINSVGDPDRGLDHPTPKPTWIMEALIRDFTDQGEIICDPFAGSGTTGVASIRLGRRFVGWERDPKYHAAATRRLAGTREQLSLLEPRRKAKQVPLL